MFVVFSDIFARIGLLTGVAVFAIGLIPEFGDKLARFWPFLTIVYILLTLRLYVSYLGAKGTKVERAVFVVVVTVIAWLARLSVLALTMSPIVGQKVGFMGYGQQRWEVQPDIKLGVDKNRYVLCTLSGRSICAEVSTPNLLFYQSYSLCNIKGELFYKEIRKLKTRDYLKKTFLNGYDLGLECEPSWISKIFDIRDFVIRKISEYIPRPQSTLLNGIIFGINVAFYPKFDNAIRSAGISHIVAASGYNVNILISALSPISNRLGKKSGIILNIVCIWFYALLTGFSSSMVRACAMSTVLFISKLLNLNVDIKKVFVLTVSILIFLNPLIVFDLGFLLSAGATYGVIYISPIVEGLIPYKWFPHATFSCTLVTLPITIYFFNTLSPYSIIANMLILPVVEIVMLLGVFGLIVKPLLYLAWGCLRYVEIVAIAFSKLPFSIVEIPNSVSPFLAILFLFLIYLLSKQDKHKLNINNH